jgi:7-cyano-7-deazaguanine synthase
MINDLLKSLPKLDNDKNVCIALSGGLDSTILVHLLSYAYGTQYVKALSFDFGQRHSIELKMAEETVEKLGISHQIIPLEYLKMISAPVSALIADSDLKPKTADENAGDPQVNTYVPFRNLQFAAIECAFAEANDCQYIFQGLNCVDSYGYWDTSIEFVESVNGVLSLNRKNQISFHAPFVELYKDDELRLAKTLSEYFGYDILESTWSCYNGDSGNHLECGVCNTCKEKLSGYVLAGYSNEEIQKKFNVSDDEINRYRLEIEA